MDTFENTPTYQIVDELLNRIEHSNGLEFVSWDDTLKLRNLLTAHLNTTWTNAPTTFIPAKEYLRSPTDARAYCRKRRDDYNTLAEHMAWHPEADGAERCAIYNLHIRRHPYDSETWGEITLPDGTLVVVKQKMQIMAYILAAYW